MKLVPHYQDHVNIFWLLFIRNVATEYDESVQMPRRYCQFIYASEPDCNRFALVGNRAEASEYLCKRCAMLPFREVARLLNSGKGIQAAPSATYSMISRDFPAVKAEAGRGPSTGRQNRPVRTRWKVYLSSRDLYAVSRSWGQNSASFTWPSFTVF